MYLTSIHEYCLSLFLYLDLFINLMTSDHQCFIQIQSIEMLCLYSLRVHFYQVN